MDLSFLSQTTPAPDFPDPVSNYTRAMNLQSLARQDREATVKERQLNEADAATKVAQKIFARAQEVGWETAMQEGSRENPQGAQMALKAYKEQQGLENDNRLKLADAAHKEAQAKHEKQTAQDLVAERLANEAHDLAEQPNLSPDRITTYMKKVKDAGMGDVVLSGVPPEQWNSPDTARDALRQVGNLFYKTNDAVKNKETASNNAATQKHAADTLAETGRYHTGELDAKAAALKAQWATADPWHMDASNPANSGSGYGGGGGPPAPPMPVPNGAPPKWTGTGAGPTDSQQQYVTAQGGPDLRAPPGAATAAGFPETQPNQDQVSRTAARAGVTLPGAGPAAPPAAAPAEGMDSPKGMSALMAKLPEEVRNMVEDMAERNILGDTSWRLELGNRGAKGASLMPLVSFQTAALRRASDMSVSDMLAVRSLQAGDQKAYLDRAKAMAAIDQAALVLPEQAQTVRNLLAKGAGPTGVPLIDRYTQWARGEIAADGDVSALHTAVTAMNREHQRLVTAAQSAAQLHISSQNLADTLLNYRQAPDQIEKVMKTMMTDAGNVQRTGHQNMSNITDRIRNRSLSNKGGLDTPPAEGPLPNNATGGGDPSAGWGHAETVGVKK